MFTKLASNKTIAILTLLLAVAGWNIPAFAAWSGSGQGVNKNGTWYVLYEDGGQTASSWGGTKEYSLLGPGKKLTFEGKNNCASKYTTTSVSVEDDKGTALWSGTVKNSYASKTASNNCNVDATKIIFKNATVTAYTFSMQKVHVTMAQYINNPTKTDLDCGTADINSDATTGQVNVAWCNVPAMSYSITDDANDLFSVSVDVNSEAGKYNTSHFTVTYKHTIAGTHTAKLVITDTYNGYSKTVNLTGTTNKLQPTVDWSSNDAIFNVDDVLSATNSNDLTVTLSSVGNESYVSCSGNTATMLTATSGKITITAHVTGNNIYEDKDFPMEITITNLEKQHITWNWDFSRLKTTDSDKSITLSATTPSGATASSGLPVSYELVGDKTGLTLTKSGNVWTLTYSAIECKNTTIVASQEGNSTYAPASSVSLPVKVVDPTKVCDASTILVNSQVSIKSSSVTYNIDIPASMTVSFSRMKQGLFDIYLQGLNVEFYSGRNGTGTKLYTEEYSADDINKSLSNSNINLSSYINAKSVKITTNATNGYYIDAVSYTHQKYCNLSTDNLAFETYPNTATSAKSFNVNYANYPIFIECSNAKFTVSPTEFGDCSEYGTQAISVSYAAGADEGSDVGYIYVKDNTGVTLRTCTLNVTISKLTQSITSTNIQSSYNTTDRVELSAEANSGLTAFEYSASPAGVASFDGNVMTFSQSGNIAITVTQPGSNVYASASTMVENVVVNKVAPTLTAPTSGTPITYLQTLNNSTLSNDGAAKVTLRDVPNTPVDGGFAWTNPSHPVTDAAGDHSYQVTFTPEDGGMYTTNTCNVTIKVNKADQAISMKDSTVYVKVTGMDASAANSQLDLSKLIVSQTQDPVAVNRTGAVTFEVTSANKANTTINGNTFYATVIGEYTICAKKAGTDYYNQTTDTFTVTVNKRLNTLTVIGNCERKVAQEVLNVRSNRNSNAIVQTSSTASDIARYDTASNKIIIPNDNAVSFNDTLVTIRIWQESNDQFEASGEKKIDLIVKKWDNPITYTWAGESNRSWTEFLNFDQGVYIYFSSENSDTNAPAITVTQDPNTTANATYYPNEHAIYASYNVGSTYWTVSQLEDYKYKGNTQKLTLVIGTITSSGCNMYEDQPDKLASKISFALPEKGTAGTLYFEMKRNGTFGNDARVCRLVGTTWDTINIKVPDNSESYKEYYLPNQTVAGIPLDPNTTAIRFAKGATVLGSYTTDDPYINNIRISRIPWMKIQNAEKQDITTLTIPTNTVSLKGQNSKTAKFYVDYSTCDTQIHVESDNSKITVSPTVFDVEHLGRKEILVTYTSNTIEEIKDATITVYTQYETKTLKVNAKTVKENQILTWKDGFEGNPVTLPMGIIVEDAATASSIYPVTYTSGNSSIIRVSDNGLSFTVVGVGETTLTAHADGDSKNWNEVTETKTIITTAKKIQIIEWNHDYTSMQQNGEEALDAKVMIYDFGTGKSTYSAERTAKIQYELFNNDAVVSIADKKLTALKENGTAKIRAFVPDDDNQYQPAVPDTLPVRVRKPSDGTCDAPLMFEGTGELEVFAFDTDKPAIEIYVILNHDKTSGDPDKLTFAVRGAAYKPANINNWEYFSGNIEVYASTDGGNTWTSKLGEVIPEKNKTIAVEAPISLPKATTHLMFVRPQGGEGYHYVRDIKVTRLPELTCDYTEVAGLPEVDLGDVMAGAVRQDYITFDYASVKGDLTTSKSNSTNANNVLDVAPVIELECGAFDTRNMPITFRPMVKGAWSEVITIRDPLANLELQVRVKANVTQGTQQIIWNHKTDLSFGDTIFLNARATSGLPVSYEITKDANHIATVQGDTIVLLSGLGSVTIEATQAGDPSFAAATPVTKTFTLKNEEVVFVGNGNWTDALEWQAGQQPGTNDDVKVSGHLTISDSYTVNSLTIVGDGVVTLVENGQLTVNGNTKSSDTYGDLHVGEGGNVVINGALQVRDLILDAALGNTTDKHAASGQLNEAEGHLYLNRDAYFQMSFDPAGKIDYGWYDFVVPFEVNISDGIFREGETQHLRDGVDFIVMEHSEAARAANRKDWNVIHSTMLPGRVYTITFDDEVVQNTFLFKKKAGSNLSGSMEFQAKCSAGESTSRGWNGLGNGTLRHTQLNNLPSGTKVQMYDHKNNVYVSREASALTYVVGTSFFMQVPSAQTITLSPATDGRGFMAPKRSARTTDEFRLALTAEDASFAADHLWVSASEEATGEYTIGRDLLKMGTPTDAKVAQMWSQRDNTRLCDIEMPLDNDGARCALSMYAPQEKEYTLSIENAPSDATLYLTYNGNVIWNLSFSPYTFYLTKGTTEGYGLKIQVRNASEFMTDVDNVDADTKTVRKVIIDNQMYIITPEGSVYSVTGMKIQ